MAIHEDLCASTLAMLHGHFIWEKGEQIGIRGKLTQCSNPWLIQFYSDLKRIAAINPELHASFIDNGWWAIFSDVFKSVKCDDLIAYSYSV